MSRVTSRVERRASSVASSIAAPAAAAAEDGRRDEVGQAVRAVEVDDRADAVAAEHNPEVNDRLERDDADDRGDPAHEHPPRMPLTSLPMHPEQSGRSFRLQADAFGL